MRRWLATATVGAVLLGCSLNHKLGDIDSSGGTAGAEVGPGTLGLGGTTGAGATSAVVGGGSGNLDTSESEGEALGGGTATGGTAESDGPNSAGGSSGEASGGRSGSGGAAAPDDKSPVLEIEAFQIDGVWVFSHAYDVFLLPASWEQSFMQAPTGLADGCLTVGGNVVVFYESDIANAEEAVPGELVGLHLTLGIHGGAGPLDDLASESVRDAIAAHCPNLNVWLAEPGAWESMSGE